MSALEIPVVFSVAHPVWSWCSNSDPRIKQIPNQRWLRSGSLDPVLPASVLYHRVSQACPTLLFPSVIISHGRESSRRGPLSAFLQGGPSARKSDRKRSSRLRKDSELICTQCRLTLLSLGPLPAPLRLAPPNPYTATVEIFSTLVRLQPRVNNFASIPGFNDCHLYCHSCFQQDSFDLAG